MDNWCTCKVQERGGLLHVAVPALLRPFKGIIVLHACCMGGVQETLMDQTGRGIATSASGNTKRATGGRRAGAAAAWGRSGADLPWLQPVPQEGLIALWKGWLPSVIGVIPYVGLNFAVYETLKDMVLKFYGARSGSHAIPVPVHRGSRSFLAFAHGSTRLLAVDPSPSRACSLHVCPVMCTRFK